MSAEKPPLTISGLGAALIIIATVAGPAITYGIASGGRDAQIAAVRDRVAVLESQAVEQRREMQSLTRELNEKVGAINVAVGKIQVSVDRLIDDEPSRN
jgi:hypothetical protein